MIPATLFEVLLLIDLFKTVNLVGIIFFFLVTLSFEFQCIFSPEQAERFGRFDHNGYINDLVLLSFVVTSSMYDCNSSYVGFLKKECLSFFPLFSNMLLVISGTDLLDFFKSTNDD